MNYKSFYNSFASFVERPQKWKRAFNIVCKRPINLKNDIQMNKQHWSDKLKMKDFPKLNLLNLATILFHIVLRLSYASILLESEAQVGFLHEHETVVQAQLALKKHTVIYNNEHFTISSNHWSTELRARSAEIPRMYFRSWARPWSCLIIRSCQNQSCL